jgi:hypothetical protein
MAALAVTARDWTGHGAHMSTGEVVRVPFREVIGHDPIFLAA